MSNHHKARAPSSTTTLPALLREELGIAGPSEDRSNITQKRRDRSNFFNAASQRNGRQQVSSVKRPQGRKETRKAQRVEKKEARAQHHRSRATASDDKFEQPTPLQAHHGQEMGDRGGDRVTASDERRKSRARPDGVQRVPEERQTGHARQAKHVADDTKTPLQRLLQRSEGSSSRSNLTEAASKRRRHKDMTATERQEEDEIAWLEAHIGRKASHKSKKSGEENADEGSAAATGEDDLDDLLGDLDRFYPGMYSDDGADEADYKSAEETTEDSAEDDFDASDLGLSTESDLASHEEAAISDDEDEFKKSNAFASATAPEEDSSANAKPSGAYVPPALRRLQNAQVNSSETEEALKLQRMAKGSLNRLGDSNIEAILSEIEALFGQFARARVTESVCKLIIDTVSSSENMTDTFLILYAAVSAGLHKIVGLEFAAHLIEKVSLHFQLSYDAARTATDLELPSSKESRSLAAFLACLYNLEVIACRLIFDVVRLFLGLQSGSKDRRRMTELDVELLLKVIKICGPQLRHDDPTSLKSIVNIAKEQTADSRSGISTRTKFMLEALSDLRNNRSRATAASAADETVSKMRKFLAGLSKKRTLRAHEPLRVGLEDLQKSDKRGKWWLIGAAWAGYDNTNGAQESEPASVSKQGGSSLPTPAERERPTQQEELTLLARRHGMNTEVRQHIFATLLSSQDYLDAVQRLLAITHKKASQRREIVRVLLHCLGQEPTFNPYYVLIGTRLAQEDEVSTRVTMQYCLWDFLRQIGEKKVGGQSILSSASGDDDGNGLDEDADEFGALPTTEGGKELSSKMRRQENVARAFAWWISKGALGLDAMRAIDFTSLRKGLLFTELLLVHLLLSINTISPAHTLRLSQQQSTASLSSAVAAVFSRGLRKRQQVATGLVVFFETELTRSRCKALARTMGATDATISMLVQSRKTAIETLQSQSSADDGSDVEESNAFFP